MYITHAFLFFKFYLETFCPEFRSGETTFLLVFHIFACVGVVKLVVHEHAMRLFAEASVFVSVFESAEENSRQSTGGLRVRAFVLTDDGFVHSRRSRNYLWRASLVGAPSVQGLCVLQVPYVAVDLAS